MKNILITGGTKGLGLAIAENLSAKNYNIICVGRSLSDKLRDLIEKHPKNISFSQLDLSSDNLHTFIKDITHTHGPLYGLINNAALGADGILATMHDSQIEDVLNVNIRAAILLTKYASRSMLPKREGKIINISSIIAETGFNGLSVYAASKAALIGFTKSLARELGKANITVNAVAPGYMETDMTSDINASNLEKIKRRSPMGKLVTPAEVAHGVAFLLSPDANSITGITLTIDGGSSI